jgi:alcohol dehydrogenase (NADP+)
MNPSDIPTLLFQNNDKMPALGLGTWKSGPGEVYKAVREAIRIGYRHFDCAARYDNEEEIGKALSDAMADGDVKREELWITSKLWNNAHQKDHVVPALKESLEKLQLDYLDLYLIHWPVALKPEVIFPSKANEFLSLEEVPLLETWQGMEDCRIQGLAKHIGVSNFSVKKLKDLLPKCRFQPEMNQVESHPYLQQKELLTYCHNNDIHFTGYSPLGSMDRPSRLKKAEEPMLLENKVIVEIAEAHDCTPAQVLIRWALQRGTSVIPKSTNPKRLQQNFAAAAVQLTDEDMQKIAGLDLHYRFIHGEFWAPEGSPYTVATLWDE